MDAAKALDCFGSFPGYTVKTGDAKGAYTQALLLGAETWVTLPENRWPKHWKGKFHRPVVRLVLALYGHADAGGFWEAHCEEKLLSIGWTRLAEEWQGVFWHIIHDDRLRRRLQVGRPSSRTRCPMVLDPPGE